MPDVLPNLSNKCINEWFMFSKCTVFNMYMVCIHLFHMHITSRRITMFYK